MALLGRKRDDEPLRQTRVAMVGPVWTRADARRILLLMAASAPPWIGRTDLLDDRARYAAMSPEERLAAFVEVCELAHTILENRPDRASILAENEPMPPAAEAAWLRLVRQARDQTPR